MCETHENKPMRFFCEECNVLFCPFCIMNHNGHKFIE